jgi:hypothetical protein
MPAVNYIRFSSSFVFVIFLSLAASGCGDGSGFAPPDSTTCAVYLWEPGDGELETWPAMEYLAADETTATGFSFSMTEERFPALTQFGAHARIAEEQLPHLDGFSVHGANYAEFSRPFDPDALPVADGLTHPSDPAGLVVFAEDGTASLHPVSITAVPDEVTDAHLLVATPMVPLPERAWAAFFVTGAAASASVDGCVSSSAGMHAAIEHPDARSKQAISALVDLGVIADARELVVLQPFVTQSLFDESLTVAADIASRPDQDFDLVIDPEVDCTPESNRRHCVAKLTATDYRNADGYIELDASGAAIRQATYVLDVQIWIPNDATGPLPTFVLGHGLGADVLYLADHAASVFEQAADDGVVVVGIDSLEHGTHPTSDSIEPVTEVMNFFAADIVKHSIDALRLNGNFMQSAFDKLQLTRAILAHPDLDGDGVDDVDTSRLGYVGVSLGAIMGPQLLALTDSFDAAVLSMPGGRMSDIVRDPESSFSVVKKLLLPSAVAQSPASTLKIFTALQTVLDRADSATYAGHVLRDRFEPTSAVPDVLVMNVIGDDTVPNAENWYFARAMDIDVAPVTLFPVPGVGTIDATPISGNLETPTRAVTAGLLQFDVVELDDGTIEKATHSRMTQSVTGRAAFFEFLGSKWFDGQAVIIDPYAATGLEHGLVN